MSKENTPNNIDADLRISRDERTGEDRAWYSISLDGTKGQTHQTLRECFNEVGFDPERPRTELVNGGHHGFSLYHRKGTTEVFITEEEAQGIRNRKYKISLAP